VAIAGGALQLVPDSARADEMTPRTTAEYLSTDSVGAAHDGPSKIVRFADLNLSRPEGMETLAARIKSAADSVCAQSGYRDLRHAEAVRECIDTALADAMAQVHALTVREGVASQAERQCKDTALTSAVAQVDALTVREDGAAR
jgi:UrcA family protein